MAKYVVTYTDFGENCDWHSRPLGKPHATKEDAEKAVREDMDNVARMYCDDGGAVIDYRQREVWKSEGEIGQIGTVWDIHEVADL